MKFIIIKVKHAVDSAIGFPKKMVHALYRNHPAAWELIIFYFIEIQVITWKEYKQRQQRDAGLKLHLVKPICLN